MITDASPVLRATVVGSLRSADLVLPTDQPIASLIGALLDLLGEPVAIGRFDLVTDTGVVLDPSARLGELPLVDGTVLRLVRSTETPPAPLVHDMVELTERARTPGRWSPRLREWVLSLVAALPLGWAASGLLDSLPAAGRPSAWWAAALFCGAGVIVAQWLRAMPAAWVLVGAAVASGWRALATGPGLGADPGAPTILGGLPAGPIGLFVIVVGAVALAGWCARRMAAAVATVTTAALVALTWAVTEWAGLDGVRGAAVVGAVAVVIIGALPRIALATSGMLRLDARVTGGSEVSRVGALDAVAQGHWSLAGGAVVAAAALGRATWVIGRQGRLEPWPVALAVCLLLAAGLRARHFPLALERLALWGATGVGAIALAGTVVAAHPVYSAVWYLLATVIGVGLLAASTITVGPLRTAQARRIASRVESAAVLALVPLVVGCFGLYGDLLASFR